MRTVDLSFTLKPHFRWKVASERRSTHESGAIFQSTIFTSSCHAYTHVDAPVHFLPASATSPRCPWTSGWAPPPSWI
jgi:kynurenine formamidase